jgi:hypothetical protein
MKEQDTRHIRFGCFAHLNPVNGTKYDGAAGFTSHSLNTRNSEGKRHNSIR